VERLAKETADKCKYVHILCSNFWRASALGVVFRFLRFLWCC
jgi:hypothetical protein